MRKDEDLYQIWKRYVDSRFLYRMVSEEYIAGIEKYGFDHKKDPFKNKKKELLKLFKIVLNLKKRGFIMMRWWGNPVDQEEVVKCTTKDLEINYIDFTPRFEKIIDYYLNLKGGALVNTILIFTEELLIKRPALKKDEWKLVRKLNLWSKRKSEFENKVVWVRASSKCFEDADFQNFVEKKYAESPFGSFDHFEKTISKKGLDYYMPFLKNEKLFYVRTKSKILPSEIFKITSK
ncbi:MAG: hypothetical protein KJ915_13795 [Candidatus Omnitrophica bacterium]|nr:hypothetical protein [Candidatus Omnitrophota bacterium]